MQGFTQDYFLKKTLLIFTILLTGLVFSQTWTPIDFDITDQDCSGSGYDELFISEVNDSPNGSYGAIEIYNPTNTTINLAGYTVRRSGDYGSGTWTWETGQAGYPNLSGNLPPGGIYLIMVGTNGNICVNTYNLSLGQNAGINGNDQIQLRKNGTVIDDVGLPNYAGYSLVRRPDAEVPKAIFSNPDWITTAQDCSGLGSHTIDNALPPTITDINRQTSTLCTTPTRVQILVADGEAPYQRSLNGGPFTAHGTGVIANLNQGNYTVIIRDANGCTVTAEFTIAPEIQTSPIILIP